MDEELKQISDEIKNQLKLLEDVGRDNISRLKMAIKIYHVALEDIGQRRHQMPGMSIMTEEASIAQIAIRQAEAILEGKK